MINKEYAQRNYTRRQARLSLNKEPVGAVRANEKPKLIDIVVYSKLRDIAI